MLRVRDIGGGQRDENAMTRAAQLVFQELMATAEYGFTGGFGIENEIMYTAKGATAEIEAGPEEKVFLAKVVREYDQTALWVKVTVEPCSEGEMESAKAKQTDTEENATTEEGVPVVSEENPPEDAEALKE